MRLLLTWVGRTRADWVAAGCREYLRRLPRNLAPIAVEVRPAAVRSQGIEVSLEHEAERIRAAIPADARRIVLDEHGEIWSTQELTVRWQRWQLDRRDVALIIGGANGVAASLVNEAEHVWSLSRLTLPHQLVRVVVIEQLYRAWTVMHDHPYHRE